MTERRWVHCPCGKRLLNLVTVCPGVVAIYMECPRSTCNRRLEITRKDDGTLTIVELGAKLIPTEEAG